MSLKIFKPAIDIFNLLTKSNDLELSSDAKGFIHKSRGKTVDLETPSNHLVYLYIVEEFDNNQNKETIVVKSDR